VISRSNRSHLLSYTGKGIASGTGVGHYLSDRRPASCASEAAHGPTMRRSRQTITYLTST
jgi:hypothetical protein